MLFDFDIDIVIPNLTPPVKRLPKYSAWLKSLTTPIQQAWQNLFVDYKTGSTYADFDIGTTYNLGDLVIWTDKCVYEASSVTSLGVGQSFSGVLPNNTAFWTRVNNNFIGTDERVKYNSQKLLFEYALNRFFRIAASPADQIYIQNNFIDVGDVFVMDTDSEESSVMPLDSAYQEDYMDLTATYTSGVYDYTIFFPIADYTALGSQADSIIRSYADVYNSIGMQYDIQTYI